MGIPKGTKLTDTPKNSTIKVRLDDKTVQQLETVAYSMNASKSEVIRRGIEIQFNALKQE